MEVIFIKYLHIIGATSTVHSYHIKINTAFIVDRVYVIDTHV